MDIYKVLKFITGNRTPAAVKLAGVWGMYILRRRFVGVFLDPVLSCNFRCKMCYFSDAEKRKSLHGTLSDSLLDALEQKVFPYALKLQIGCGAEPTLYPRLVEIVERGKRAGVPYISLTTNGHLIGTGRVDLESLVRAGLDEITVSLHGTDKETYETLMPGGDFKVFKELLSRIANIKSKCDGKPVLRVNYTVNSLNVSNLTPDRFWPIWEEAGVLPDVLQVRPVQNMGPSAWNDFDLSSIKKQYDLTIGPLIARCKDQGITIIAPSLDDIDNVATPRRNVDAVIEDITYCYVSPAEIYKPDFKLENGENICQYLSRSNVTRRIWHALIHPGISRGVNVSKKLNYKIK